MAFSEELREFAATVSNWGRWGEEDQLGCGNFLTAEAALRGARSIQSGEAISLAVNLDSKGIQVGQPAGRVNASLSFSSLHERDAKAPGIWLGCDDLFTMSTCAATHIDCLSHISYDGLLYGGKPKDLITAEGATWCGAETLKPISTRGILVDLLRQEDADILESGYSIDAADMDRAYELAGLEPQPGDIVCVRTGEIRDYFAGNRYKYAVGEDGSSWQKIGLSLSATKWFHEHDIAGAFLDNYHYEVMPPSTGNWDDLLVVHMIQLRDMGFLQGQNWNFEGLAEACHRDGRMDFHLVAVPEPLVGATSAPVAPVALR